MELCKSTKHRYRTKKNKNCNTNKINEVNEFLDDYGKALQLFFSYLYNNPITYKKKIKEEETIVLFSLKDNLLDCPGMYDYNVIKFDTKLSARALSSAMTQACGIVKGIAKQRTRLIDKIEYCKLNGYSTKFSEELLEKHINSKEPELKNINAELSSKCCKFYDSDTSFDGFLKLSALGDYENIWIPIQFTNYIKNLKKEEFQMKGSFLFCKDHVQIRWSKKIELRKEGMIVGCDTGVTTVATFSEENILGFDDRYSLILDKIKRKRKGSNAYKRALVERDNLLRCIINQCNLDGVKQINVEKNGNLKYKKHTSMKLKSHAWGVIRNKIESFCNEHGVRVSYKPSAYRSQRCSQSGCGWTQKSNRKGKIFCCKKCGYTIDSDLNGSRNQTVVLPWLPWKPGESKLNLKGFFWNPDGIFLDDGRSLESLLQDNTVKLL